MTRRIDCRRESAGQGPIAWSKLGCLLAWAGVACLLAAADRAAAQQAAAQQAAAQQSPASQAPADQASDEKPASDKRPTSEQDAAQQATGAAGTAAANSKKTTFIRLVRDDQGGLVSMDTAIVRYVPKSGMPAGVVVDLIGVVHVGERDYYEKLNKEFQQYDALLYELVAPANQKTPAKGQPSAHPISALQTGMKDMLDLEYQLSHIDYRQKNFVHADMSDDQFAQSMTNRGESLWTIFLRSIGNGIAQETRNKGRSSGLPLFLAMMQQDRSVALKRMMAEQFEDLDGSMAAFGGADGGSTLITERNKVALKVLQEQLDQGKKRIGIFYGAGHMSDMEARLLAEFGMQTGESRWLRAWDLQEKPAGSGSQPKNGSNAKPAEKPPVETEPAK